MTICSWRTQSMNFARSHAKLRNSKARYTTTSVPRNRHSALCQRSNLEGRYSEMTFATSLKSIRLMHRYLGLFFAPTILFFAITGGLQMFGLHETSRGSSYLPPDILVHLSQLHKKGTVNLPPRKVAPPNSVKPDVAKPDGPKLEIAKPVQAPPPSNSLPMKIFFAATALALAVSTFTGLIMGWKYARRKSIVLLTLAAGVVIPVIVSFV